ncbi:hypothetical protein GLOIN_2v1782827 [Rhizophagus clarus]|uniref:Uncharacterized protein n=1 Tax=Rhizophagus clarus TaxID=94130 RepID=A0A8H3M9W5_9GLOM|nr:hypothetical protein GLOIN_2v1782827 [Rhizophagus clarus]
MDKKDWPAYTKRLCCAKPELTVYMSGNIKNVSNRDLEDWLRKIVSPPKCFEHIVKRDPNMLGILLIRISAFLRGQVSYPGVNHKEQVEIDVNDDNKSITINARGLETEQNGSVIFNNLSTKFEINIDLQKKVNLKEKTTVVIENGITTVQFKMMNNKMKIPIA